MSLDVQRINAVCGRAAVVARLRQLLPRMEERGCARVLPFGARGDRRPASAGRSRARRRARAHRGGRGRHAGRLRLHGGASRPCRGRRPGRDAGLAGAFAPQPRRLRQPLWAWAEGARPSARPAPPPRDRGRPAGPVGARGGAAPARRPGACRVAWRQARSQGQPPPADRRRKFRRTPSRAAPAASRGGECGGDPLAGQGRARRPRPLRLLRALAMAHLARTLPQRTSGGVAIGVA
jgi:hypothetical protein